MIISIIELFQIFFLLLSFYFYLINLIEISLFCFFIMITFISLKFLLSVEKVKY
jgi:hypothetical protein